MGAVYRHVGDSFSKDPSLAVSDAGEDMASAFGTSYVASACGVCLCDQRGLWAINIKCDESCIFYALLYVQCNGCGASLWETCQGGGRKSMDS